MKAISNPKSPKSMRQLEGKGELELLRVSTAGSVDDGKSTLIGRLIYDSMALHQDQIAAVKKASAKSGGGLDLSFFTDGLKAEREQKITIDVAYRYFTTARRRFILADTPGHEQYTRNMATGASSADVAVILADAQRGLTVQSKRHAFIASLLGIKHWVLALNKMDLMNYDEARFEEIRSEFFAFASRLGTYDLIAIPISALHGDNVVHSSQAMPWYSGPTLLSYLENVYIGADQNLISLRFPVQLMNRGSDGRRYYAGQVSSGQVRVGEEVMVLPRGQVSKVQAISTFDGEREEASCGESVALVLENELDVSRGDMIVRPGNRAEVGTEIEAMLVWMGEGPMRLGSPYQLKQCSRWSKAKIAELHYCIDPETLHRKTSTGLSLNEIGRVRIESHLPLIYDEYAAHRTTGSFILVDLDSNATVAAGMIIRRPSQKGGEQEASEALPQVFAHEGVVSLQEREQLLGQKPVTLWCTGLSGSGKSTLARELEARLLREGKVCVVLDGDNMRLGLNSDLDFSLEGRRENLRRIAQVAKLLNDSGIIVIAATISPRAENRSAAKAIIGEERFREVFVDAPLELCQKRDPKRLYEKAQAGLIANFTGVGAGYDRPSRPDLHLDSGSASVEELVSRLMSLLR